MSIYSIYQPGVDYSAGGLKYGFNFDQGYGVYGRSTALGGGTATTATGAGQSPLAMPAAAGSLFLGMAIGSAIGNIYSAFVGSKATAAVQKAQASVMADNAEIARMGVEQSYRQGEEQIAQITRKAAQVKGKQKASMAANGVALGVGSSAEVLASTDVLKEIDVKNARMNALSQAWGYNRSSLMYGAQSSGLSSIASYNSSTGAWASANASALSGATQVAQWWTQMYGVSR